MSDYVTLYKEYLGMFERLKELAIQNMEKKAYSVSRVKQMPYNIISQIFGEYVRVSEEISYEEAMDLVKNRSEVEIGPDYAIFRNRENDDEIKFEYRIPLGVNPPISSLYSCN